MAQDMAGDVHSVDSEYGKKYTFRISKLCDMITSLSAKSNQVGSEPDEEDP
jgi:hypothetical protein